MNWQPMIDNINSVYGDFFPKGFVKASLSPHGGPRITIGGRDIFFNGDGACDGTGCDLRSQWSVSPQDDSGDSTDGRGYNGI